MKKVNSLKETLNTGEDTDVNEYAKENNFKGSLVTDKVNDKQDVTSLSVNNRKVRQIIIYYDDNTFETFTPH